MLAQISDLVQKQIDANADVQEVTEESILNPIVIAPSKMVFRDNLFKVVSNTVAEGLIAYLPIDPDLDKMRLWVLNEHGGRYLTDHSFMGNKIQLNGSDQSKMIWSTVDDTLEGSTVVNQLIDDQYLRVEDKDTSPNTNVRIKEIVATEQGISVFIRIYVQRNENELNFGKPGVLFSKIDTEQVDFAYGAYLKNDGSLIWFVRDTGREYVLTAPAASLVYAPTNLPDYTDTDFSPSDYHTVSTIDALPDPIPFTDLTFTFQFSNKRLQIYKSQIASATAIIADSNNSPDASGLVGAWRMNEGGDIGNTPDNPVSFARTVYNRVTTGNNGTITSATWDADNFLNFDGNNDFVDTTNYTAIQNLSAWTVSLWYYPKAMPSTDAYLARKGSLTASSWLVYHMSNGSTRFSVWNATPTRFDITATSTITSGGLNNWYHIVAKVTLGSTGKIFVNNVKTTGGGNVTGTVDTSTNVLRFGGTTTSNTPNGLIHDVRIFNRELSDAEVSTLYTAGHPATYLPSWQANPPTAAPPPGPITNPFVSVYNTGVPAAGEQDLVRLHQITATSLTERYNVGQGAQETPPGVPEQGEYSNDPTYDTGTAPIQAVSDYNQLATTPVASQKMTLNNTTFGGQKFLTGINVVGKPFMKVDVKMADINPNNTPATGTITGRIVNAAGTSIQAVAGSVLAENLVDNQGGASTSNWTTNTFTFAGTYTMATGDKIQFEYDQGGTSPETLSLYDQLNATLTAGQASAASSTYIIAEKFLTGNDVIGKVITKVSIKLCDGNPSGVQATGNVVAKIYSGTSLKSTSNTIDASTLADNQGAQSTTAYTPCTFTFSGNAWPMANGDRVQFEYDQGGAGGDSTVSGHNTLATTPNGIYQCSYNYLTGFFCDTTSSGMYNKIITKIEVKMCDRALSGVQANGNIECSIVNGQTGSYVQTAIGDVQAQGLANNTASNGTGSFTTVTFTFPGNTFVMRAGIPVGSNKGDGFHIKYKFQTVQDDSAVAVAGFATGTITGSSSDGYTTFGGWGFPQQATSEDWCVNVYAATPQKVVGVPRLATSVETNANLAEALWSAPTTFTDYTSYDLAMNVYTQSAAGAKAVGIPYLTTGIEANSNSYDAPWSTGTITDRSTFDILADVYIDVKTGSPNHQYTQLRLDANKFVCEIVNSSSAPIYNKKMTKIICRAYKVGTPTGTLFCRLKKGSDGTTITFGLNGVAGTGKDVSTLGTANNPAATLTFENDDNGQTTGYATQVGDRIMFELSGGSSTSVNYVQIARTTTASMVQNMELQTSADGSTWTAASNDDIIGNMYSGGYTPPPIFPYHTLGYVNSRIAQKVTNTTVAQYNLYNQRITQVKPWLKRIGSPSGTINVVIRNAADSLVANINTYDASSVSNAVFEQITFTNLNQSYTMALNDKICVEFSGGDINNHIQCNTNLLDTYPYGNLETFAGSTYTTQTGHDLAGNMSSGGGASDPLARTRVGEKVVTTNSALKLKKISRITVYMKRTVSPTGNVTFRIRNSSDAIVATLGTLAAGTIDPNTPTAYTITSSPISSYALQVGDHVSVEYNAGDDANFVEIMTSKTTDIFDGTTNTYLSKFDDVNWVPNNAIDLVGQMWEGGDSYTPSQEDVVIPPPKYTKDLHVLAGGPPWTWINHDLTSTDFAPSQLFVNAVMPDFRFYRKVLTSAELENIRINRIDRGAIALGQVSKFAYTFINET